MSVERVRCAAIELRATVNGAADGTVSEPEFKVAVADLLDNVAFYYGSTPGQVVKWANIVADAVLGES